MNVREAVFDWFERREIRYLFGNPGSTELPFLVGFPQGVRYVLALQESIAVAMADGYAQAGGRPAIVNLHAAPGLGNAMGVLYTAAKNHAPLVVTTGQQDTRHLLLEPLLYADLVSMARPVVKWAYEVAHPSDVPAALEQAYLLAASPPPGPVFLSIPVNFWDAPSEPVPLRQLNSPSAPQGLETLGEALAQAVKPALVIGAGVDRARAWEEAVQLAERLGCAVFGAPIGSRIGFPTDHPLYRGMVLPAAPRLVQALSGHDVIVVIGAPLFLLYPYLPGPLVPAGSRAFLLTDDPAEAARAPAEAAFVGDLKAGLKLLLQKVPAREYSMPSRAAEEARNRAEAARARSRMGATYVLHTLARHLPPEAIILDEAVSASLCLRAFVPIRRPGGYYTSASGGLGWAMPAALGVKLACPHRPVIAVIGDGSALYSIQALWTAAYEGIKVVYLILNNAGYTILKSFTKAFYPGLEGTVPGLEVPLLDLVPIAQGMGLQAERVEKPDELEEALQRALNAPGAYLLDVQIDRTVPSLL